MTVKRGESNVSSLFKLKGMRKFLCSILSLVLAASALSAQKGSIEARSRDDLLHKLDMSVAYVLPEFTDCQVHWLDGRMTASPLNICAFVLFFTVFLRILTYAGVLPALAGGLSALLSPLGLSPLWAQWLLTGLVELSSGVTSLTDGPLSGRLSMAAFMLGWAGMCVHCQVLAFLGDSGLSLRTYVGGKALHALLSSLLAAGLYRLFPLAEPAASYLARQTEAIAALDFSRALTISAGAAWVTFLLFLALALRGAKKTSGKSRARVV